MKRVAVLHAFNLSVEVQKYYFIAIKFACCQTIVSSHLLFKAKIEENSFS